MDDIKQLVQSIQKHTNFKRLAAYSLSSLCKKCTPPSNGWQDHARTAFEAGAAPVLATVLLKNSRDPELMLLGLTQLQAMAAAGMAKELVESRVLTDVIRAFDDFSADAKLRPAIEAFQAGHIVGTSYSPTGPDAEKVAVFESCLRLLLFVAAQARNEAAQPGAGIIAALLPRLSTLPTPNALRLAMQALEAMARTPAGFAQLIEAEALRAIIAATAVLFTESSPSARASTVGDLRTDRVSAALARRNVLSPSAMAPGASRVGAGTVASRLHAHLESAFRLFDRVSRDERGLAALRGCKAVPQLAPAVELARIACGTSTGDMAVRVLARVLGNDVGALIDRVAGVGRGDVAVSEGEFAASLLASLALDGTVVSALVNGGSVPSLAALLDANSGAASTGGVAAGISQALGRISLFSTDGLNAVLQAGAIARIMKAVRLRPDDNRLLTEGLTAVSDLISEEEHVDEANAVPSGVPAASERSNVDFVLNVLRDRGAADAELACACVSWLHSLAMVGYELSALYAAAAEARVLAAMTSPTSRASEHVDLQVVGTLLLQAMADDPLHVDAIVKAGGIVAAISNLRYGGASHASARHTVVNRLSFDEAMLTPGARASTAIGGAIIGGTLGGMAGAEDASGPARPSNAGFRTSETILVAVSLKLLTVLCSKPEHVTLAKGTGIIRAMLGAFTRHHENDVVFVAFSELVKTIIFDTEVSAAVASVARGTAALKTLTGDAALFGIVEQELGEEGLLPDASAAASGARAGHTSLAAVAAGLSEDLCLLEAVSTSTRLAGVLVEATGVSVIIRCMGFVSMIKKVASAAAAAANTGSSTRTGRVAALASAGLRSGADGGLLAEPLQEEILVRCSNSLTNLARLQIDSVLGLPGLDPVTTSVLAATGSNSHEHGFRGFVRALSSVAGAGQAPEWRSRWLTRMGLGQIESPAGHRRTRSGQTPQKEFSAIQANIASVLYRPVVLRTIIRALNARSSLKAHVASACIALGVISTGRVAGGPQPLDMMIALSGVEAIVGALRTHSNWLPVFAAATNALGCISATGRAVDEVTGLLKLPAPDETPGTAAITTRGASRQIIRELQTAAAPPAGSGLPGSKWMGLAGDIALCSALRALLCVADTSKGMELLRKQGTVEALVATLDAGASAGDAAAEREPTSTAHGHTSTGASTGHATGGDGEGTQAAVANALQGDAFASLGLESDAGGDGGDSSTLSSDANALIIAILSKLMDTKNLEEAVRVVNSSAEKATGSTLKTAGATLCKVALTTVLAICEGTQANDVDPALWLQALEACSSLVRSLVGKATAAEADVSEGASQRMAIASKAAEMLLPAAIHAVDAIIGSRLQREAAGSNRASWITAAQHAASGSCDIINAVCSAAGATASSAAAGAILSTLHAADGRLHHTLQAAMGPSLHALRSLSRTADICSHFVTSPAICRSLATAAQERATARDFVGSGLALETIQACLGRGDAAAAARAFLAGPVNLAAVLQKMLPELLASGAPAGAVGVALQVLGSLAAADPATARKLRDTGAVAMVKQALQRYCDAAVTVDVLDAVAVAGRISVLRGATMLFSPLIGLQVAAGADSDSEAAHKADVELATRIVSLVADDSGRTYVASCPAMTSVCSMIATMCTPTEKSGAKEGGAISAKAADAARAALLDVQARTVVVSAMGNAAADAELVHAGARALAALGAGASGAVTDVRKAVQSCRKLLGLPAIAGLLAEVAPELETVPLSTPQRAAEDKTASTAGAALEALRELESSTGNLAALVGGERALSPLMVRFIFDTLGHAGATAAALQQLILSNQLKGHVTQLSNDLPAHAAREALASPASSQRLSSNRAPSVGAASPASETASKSRMRTGSTLFSSRVRSPSTTPASRSVAPRKATALSGGALAPSAIEAAIDGIFDDSVPVTEFIASADVVSIACAQGVARLADVAARVPGVLAAGAAAPSRQLDSPTDEKLKYGDPKNTDSHRRLLEATGATVAVGAAPVSSPVGTHEVADLIALLSWLRPQHLGRSSGTPAGVGAMGVERVEALARSLDAITRSCHRGPLFSGATSSGPTSPSSTLSPASSSADSGSHESPLSVAPSAGDDKATEPATALAAVNSVAAEQVLFWTWALVARGLLPAYTQWLREPRDDGLGMRLARGTPALLHASIGRLLREVHVAGALPILLQHVSATAAAGAAGGAPSAWMCSSYGATAPPPAVAVVWQLLEAMDAVSRPQPQAILAAAVDTVPSGEADEFLASQFASEALASAFPQLRTASSAISSTSYGGVEPLWELVRYAMPGGRESMHRTAPPALDAEHMPLPTVRILYSLVDAFTRGAVSEGERTARSGLLLDKPCIEAEPLRAEILLQLVERVAPLVFARRDSVDETAGHELPMSTSAGEKAAVAATSGTAAAAAAATPATVIEHPDAEEVEADSATPLPSAGNESCAAGVTTSARPGSDAGAGRTVDLMEAMTKKASQTWQTMLAHALYDRAVRALGHIDFDATPGTGALRTPTIPAGAETPASTTRSASRATPSAPLVMRARTAALEPSAMSVYRGGIRQPKCDVAATAMVQVLRRVCGLNSPSLSPPAIDRSRVTALVDAGVFQRVMVAMGLHAESAVYAREAIRLLRDVAMHIALLDGREKFGGPDLVALKIDDNAMKALQAAVKRHGEDGGDSIISTQGAELLDALADVYANVSGRGFLIALRRAVEAAEGCHFVRKAVAASGGGDKEKTIMYFDKTVAGSAKAETAANAARGTKDAPPEFVKMLDTLQELLTVCEILDPDAVPVVPVDLIKRAADAMQSYRQDSRVAGVLARALHRATDHASNLPALGTCAIMEAVGTLTRYHRSDAFVAEAVAAFFRPLSVIPECINIMKEKNVVVMLCDLAEEHRTTLLPVKVRGARVNTPDKGSAEVKVLESLMSPTIADDRADAAGAAAGTPSDTKAFEPRIAHYCVQVLANIACDQHNDDEATIPHFKDWEKHIGDGCPGGVARIVAAGGVDVLKDMMNSHLERPRVLEDALCAMSNIAYSTDGIRLLIGRTSASIIVQVLRVFNSDPFLFSMALRAIGNLTRCDENIISVVGFGVSEGIIEGMRKNTDDPEVLRLAADVVGNLASVEDAAIDRKDGLKALRAGMRKRAKQARGSAHSSPSSSGTATPIPGSDPRSTTAASSSALPADSSLHDAVTRWLLDDGTHEGLCAAMVQHNTDAELVSACLRALQYMGETREQVERMQSTMNIAEKTCFVMRSCDYDPELCVRGALLLAQMLRHGTSFTKPAAFEAGAAQVLLSVLHTHQTDYEVVSNIVRIMLLLGPDDGHFIDAAAPGLTYDTLLSVARACAEILLPGGRSLGAAGAARAGARPTLSADGEDSPEPRKLLADLDQADAHLLLRQTLAVLAAWATRPDMALVMCNSVCRTLVSTLTAHECRLLSDVAISEAGLGILSTMAEVNTDTAPVLLSAGVMSMLRPLPTHVDLLDRETVVRPVLNILRCLGNSSPETAHTAMEQSAHGVCQGIAVHWALKRMVPEPLRHDVYSAAGRALRALCDASHHLRLQHAADQARAKAELEAAAVAGEGAAKEGGSGGSRRGSFEAVTAAARPEVKALKAEEKSWEQEMKRREKEAHKLAKQRSKRLLQVPAATVPSKHEFEALDIMQLQAGLIPWELFPYEQVDMLASTEDANVAVWFLPHMSDTGKLKGRKMKLTLSSDLRILTWTYYSRRHKRDIAWSVDVATVTNIRVGVQLNPGRKPFFSRSANPQRGVCLDNDRGTVFHAEAANADEQDLLLRTLAVLCQYARARTGALEPMPPIHVPLSMILGDKAAPSAASIPAMPAVSAAGAAAAAAIPPAAHAEDGRQ